MTTDDAVAVLNDDMTAADIGPRLTCREADALAALLRATGSPLGSEAAQRWIDGHRVGDEAGDSHYEEGAGR
jgi:hypothetical protein